MATPMEEDLPEAEAAAAVAGGDGDGEKPTQAPAAPPSDPDLDSSDSDDDGREGGVMLDELRIQAMERILQGQPLDYDSHVQYIRCLRKSGNIEKLRAAREEMNKCFPLTPKMWQEWTKDESSLRLESFENIEKLYERGVQEYLSVRLWRDYLDFVEENDKSVSQCSPSGLTKMRNLFEHAITAGGLHVTEGGKLWEAYREYEMAILTIIDDEEEKAKQVQRIRVLFHRQLSIPLADMESTLAEYKSWEAEQGNANDPSSDFDGVPSNVVSAYKKAIEMYNVRKQYEDQLINGDVSDSDKLQEFLKYIKFEESSGDPARVQVLYERAVSELPVVSDLWMGYTNYLDKTLKVPAVLKSVYHRATRNCTWVSELWVRYLLSLERIRASEEELRHVFEQAIQCSFPSIKEYLDIYLTRVDSLRRRIADGLDFQLIRQTFMDATEFLSPQMGTEDLLLLHAYWAKLECTLGNDLASARGVWENTLKKSGSVLEVWQHYIAMEIETGHIHEARSLYKRCYTKRFAGSGSEDICHAWIRFEREHGTLDDYDLAVKKADPRLKELMMFKAQQEVKVDTYSVPKETTANDSSQKRKPSKMPTKQEPPAKKRKDNPPKSAEPSDDQRSKEQSSTDNVKAGDVSGEKTEASMEMNLADSSRTEYTSSKESKPNFYSDKCTAYVSNIDLTANEEHIRRFFSDVGGVTAIRLLRDKFTKKSRGLAYVDFLDNEHLEAAIRKNKHKLLGKKVSVARSDPSKGKKSREAGSFSKDQDRLTASGDRGEKAVFASKSDKEIPKDEPKIIGKNTFAAPRSVVKPLGWTKKDDKSDVGAEELKSNEEFRNLLLKKRC
ncbi:squamous cell carcinoma antigen recognized by T-cells 3 [Oryza brachyantha]|uniref:RRM domain-containing protein n=1 Tax=Oryza brachyantha TaxID=4533 RepID=J3MPT6_ORYBR|nr:squamous cell carcinoma antigen recognized by T-cells 3 [Oryza brachyantha]XP_006659058.1 squamous cell carcinoma antigen recognized by T-cells 3 [Oryza brachyantha]